MKITVETSLETVAVEVGAALARRGISAVLTGGACAGIYSGGLYSSPDVDFILAGRVDLDLLDAVMAQQPSLQLSATAWHSRIQSTPLRSDSRIAGDIPWQEARESQLPTW